MISSSTSYPHWTQVYGEGAGKDEWPRVYRDRGSAVRVFHGLDAESLPIATFGPNGERWPNCLERRFAIGWSLLTGPEAAEYVAAAREGRDAVWPVNVVAMEQAAALVQKDYEPGGSLCLDDPYPHYYRHKNPLYQYWIVQFDDECFGFHHTPQAKTPIGRSGYRYERECFAGESQYERGPVLEAAALLAKWEGERKSEGEKRTEKWFTKEEAERRVGEIVASVKPADPRRRVKHTWTGKCGSIITTHGGIAFVDWDGEDASSMFLGLLVDEDAKPPVPEASPPALPGAEEVAVLRRKIAQMEKHLRWIAYEPIGPANNTAEAILDEITNTTRAVIFELAKPECRVKHDWTGAMGTVLMEHAGTSFVKWDDGQVTSVYNRHLQKELV